MKQHITREQLLAVSDKGKLVSYTYLYNNQGGWILKSDGSTVFSLDGTNIEVSEGMLPLFDIGEMIEILGTKWSTGINTGDLTNLCDNLWNKVKLLIEK